jgi:hypothetical protein
MVASGRIENYQREITAAMCVTAGLSRLDQTYEASTFPHMTPHNTAFYPTTSRLTDT